MRRLMDPLAKPIRVAVLSEPPGGSTSAMVAATVRRAAQALAEPVISWKRPARHATRTP